ncbi:hypothetical protein F5884DRAFT_41102 [Xylogone sp. PMI_703]|nr:hypothetical protein F5884DRAFT_41102 [Xylogone sp. PMI_703]
MANMDSQNTSRRPLAPLPPAPAEAIIQAGLQPPTSQDGALVSDGPHRKRVACSECRQAKLRCDRSNDARSQSCSRCRRLRLDCQVDLAFKRVNKRLKINELAEQVDRLNSVVGSLRNESESGRDSSNNVPTDPREVSAYASNKEGSMPTSLSPPSVSASSHHTPANYQPLGPSQSRSLETIELPGERISHMFKDYFEHYHHFFEILDPTLSPDQYYSRSPLLFWCIISIASRRYADDLSLLAALNPSVTKLSWSTISVLPHSRYTVQALLLLAFWSFPTNSMSTDQSFLHVSVAKTAAMQLGLHRPETVQDYRRVKTHFALEEFQETMKVWAGCFIVAQAITSTAGQQSLFPYDDWAIERACALGNKYTLPDDMRHILMIQKFLDRVHKTMSENSRSPNGYPSDSESNVLMSILERDFTVLETEICFGKKDIHKILLLGALLHLRIYYFFMPLDQPIRREGLLKAYATAMDLVRAMSKADASFNFLLYVPDSYAHLLTTTGMMLMKIINSKYSHFIDVTEGKKAFNSVVTMLRKSSVEDNDLRGRGSKIISQLWGLHHTLNSREEREPVIHMKSRRSASLLHDSLWMWREEFGGQRNIQDSTAVIRDKGTNELPSYVPENRGSIEMQLDGADSVTEQNPWVYMQSANPLNGRTANEEIMFGNEFGSFDNMNQGLEAADWMWDFGYPPILPIDENPYQNMPQL